MRILSISFSQRGGIRSPPPPLFSEINTHHQLLNYRICPKYSENLLNIIIIINNTTIEYYYVYMYYYIFHYYYIYVKLHIYHTISHIFFTLPAWAGHLTHSRLDLLGLQQKKFQEDDSPRPAPAPPAPNRGGSLIHRGSRVLRSNIDQGPPAVSSFTTDNMLPQ